MDGALQKLDGTKRVAAKMSLRVRFIVVMSADSYLYGN